jgi:hypothetical protein
MDACVAALLPFFTSQQQFLDHTTVQAMAEGIAGAASLVCTRAVDNGPLQLGRLVCLEPLLTVLPSVTRDQN